MGFCSGLAKVVLIICNIIFFLLGLLMLIFGIIGKASPDKITTIFEHIIPDDEYKDLQAAGVDIAGIVTSNAIFMIVLGAIALVIAGLGLFGACCLIKWMLIIYIICVVIILLAEIALIIFAAVYNNKFREKMQKGMLKTIKEEFEQGIQVNRTGFVSFPTGTVELGWAGIQLKGKCCGAYNWTDYEKAEKWTKKVKDDGSNAKVPLSCCKKQDKADDPLELSDFTNPDECLKGIGNHINQKNCFDAYEDMIEKFIEKHKGIAIGIAAGIVGFEIILIIFAIILCVVADKEDKFV